MDKTLPQLLEEKALTIGDRVALRQKALGIWQTTTWRQYRDRVMHFALGLASMGFERGQKVALIGDNRPQWLIGALAAQALGGVSVGLYQDSLPKELAYVINHSEARFVIVEDQEQVDKLLEVEDELPAVEAILYYDPRGMRSYRHPKLHFFDDVLAAGEAAASSSGPYNEAFYRQELRKGSVDDVAILCYTSGTTGVPKGAMLTHRNLINMAESLLQVDPLEIGDEYLSFLPLAWIGEQMMSLSAALTVGFTVNFPEEPWTVQENLREIGPHVMFSPPRIYEDLVSKIQVRMQDASWLKRMLYRFFFRYGQRMADAKFRKVPPSLWTRVMYLLGDWLVFSAIKDHYGLLRLRRAYTGGAALGPDVFRFFHSLGVNLKQIYGQTEISGIAVVHRDGDIKFETVGVPIPGTEVKISEEGEILLKSPSVFAGYYKNEKATADTLRDGWLRTGDAGYVDEDGHLVIIDRLKDVIRLSSGELLSPQYIENKLKFSPYIKEAVAIGQGRPYVTAILNIDMANVGRWAETNQIAYTTYTDLSQKREVRELIRGEVARINGELPEHARVRRFVLLYKELDADDEELTRTRKVRRGFIAEKYRDVIEGLYSEHNEIEVEATVRYRDGNLMTFRTRLAIVDVDRVPEEEVA